MSDIDLLRRAAAKMRELAEEAQHYTRGGRWEAERVYQESWTVIPIGIMDSDYDVPRDQRTGDDLTRIHREEAKHIAAWDPVVALAVALWLEWVVDQIGRGNDVSAVASYAREVARALLREEQP